MARKFKSPRPRIKMPQKVSYQMTKNTIERNAVHDFEIALNNSKHFNWSDFFNAPNDLEEEEEYVN